MNVIEAVVHQKRTPTGERKVAQMVRVKDYDVQANRWVIEPIWPAEQPVRETPPAATAAAKRAAKPRARARRRKTRRRSG